VTAAQRALSAVGFWALWWVVLLGVWEANVATGETTEVLAGAVAAALGATLAEAVRRRGLARVRIRARWLVPLLRVPFRLVAELGILVWALLLQLAGRRVRGSYRAVPFPAGRSDPDSRGRRALATLVGTISPNTIVVDVDPERKVALKHDLLPGRASGTVP
jgi:hypothetical protein